MTAAELKNNLTTRGKKNKLQFPRALREQFERECGFTDDELEILRLRARGKSVEEIAQIRYCCPETVKRRIRVIKNKIADCL